MRRLIFFFVCLILSSCCSVDSKPYPKPVGAWFNRAKKVFTEIEFTDDFTQEERRKCYVAASFWLMMWEIDNQIDSLPTKLVITKELIDCNPRKDPTTGCYYPGENTIYVTAGKDCKLFSLYHELCHRFLTQYRMCDPGHTDSRWEAWNVRRQLLYNIYNVVDDHPTWGTQVD